MRRLLAGALLTLAIASPRPTAGAVLSLKTQSNGFANTCGIIDPGPGGEATVYVVLQFNNSGVLGAEFSAPIPPNSGWTHTYDEPIAPFLSVGDSQSDVSLAFGSCETDNSIPIMAMHFVRTSAGDPWVAYRVAPDPVVGGAVIVDCNYNVQQVRPGEGVIFNPDGSDATNLPPTGPSPADGALEVPLVASLGWNEGENVCNESLDVDAGALYFGTEPDPPFIGNARDHAYPYQVGPLQPATTYYWRVISWGTSGPVWHFTTAGPNAVKTSTWGGIKALYR